MKKTQLLILLTITAVGANFGPQLPFYSGAPVEAWRLEEYLSRWKWPQSENESIQLVKEEVSIWFAARRDNLCRVGLDATCLYRNLTDQHHGVRLALPYYEPYYGDEIAVYLKDGVD
ncbi:MAG: hypothetical protein GF399_09035 [Candidatus Coatesbacteria bacterium]|nr:hypothetical protein [Candidatus Coatesbacteria bacterium]